MSASVRLQEPTGVLGAGGGSTFDSVLGCFADFDVGFAGFSATGDEGGGVAGGGVEVTGAVALVAAPEVWAGGLPRPPETMARSTTTSTTAAAAPPMISHFHFANADSGAGSRTERPRLSDTTGSG